MLGELVKWDKLKKPQTMPPGAAFRFAECDLQTLVRSGALRGCVEIRSVSITETLRKHKANSRSKIVWAMAKLDLRLHKLVAKARCVVFGLGGPSRLPDSSGHG